MCCNLFLCPVQLYKKCILQSTHLIQIAIIYLFARPSIHPFNHFSTFRFVHLFFSIISLFIHLSFCRLFVRLFSIRLSISPFFPSSYQSFLSIILPPVIQFAIYYKSVCVFNHLYIFTIHPYQCVI